MSVPGRAGVESARERVLAAGSWAKPAVFVARVEGRSLVVKDAARTAFLWRPIARWLLRREERVLRRVEGIPGLPLLLGRIDRNAIALSVVEGRPLSYEAAADARPDFFEGLDALVASLHDCGVVHLDLRQKRNILVGPDGRPRIVDFGAALAPPSFLGPWLRAIDRSAAIKHRLKYRPGSVDEAASAWHRRFERIRRLWFVSGMRRRRPGEAGPARRP